MFCPVHARARAGFNLCFFDYGSKRATINAFAKSKYATRGHVVVVNGYIPSLQVKHVPGAIEQVPGAGGGGRGGRWGQAASRKRIYDFSRNTHIHTHTPALYLIVHDVDTPALRDAKTRTVLSTLALPAYPPSCVRR